jgi:hypothetical protein
MTFARRLYSAKFAASIFNTEDFAKYVNGADIRWLQAKHSYAL